MNYISPALASELAQDIYLINDPFQIKIITERDIFLEGESNRKQLSAELGSRLLRANDGFGVCARGAGEYQNDIFVIFRGTTGRNKGADFITDAYCGLNVGATGSLVHAGFNQVFDSLRSELSNFIGQHSDVHQVHCIGHSLGGAITNLAADWIANGLGKDVRLYTFGSPRVGWGAVGFPSKLTEGVGSKNIYRVHHGNDPVTMVPVFPFAHAPTKGRSYYIPYQGFVINFSAHKMTNYIESVSGSSWSDLKEPMPSLNSRVKAWLESDADENPNSPIFWQKLEQAFAYVIQLSLSGLQARVVAGITVIDYLTMMLHKGVTLATEAAESVLQLMRKMMKTIGMQVAETAEELTQQLIKTVLTRLLSRLYREAQRALAHLMD